jgi:hypothetical protein
MKYLTIYRPYELAELRREGKKGDNGEAVAKDWDTALNKKAKDNKIINSGFIVSGGDAIFWAILESP